MSTIVKFCTNPTSDPITSMDGEIFSACVLPDGKIAIGGDFTTVGGFARPCVALLSSNMGLDQAFFCTNAWCGGIAFNAGYSSYKPYLWIVGSLLGAGGGSVSYLTLYDNANVPLTLSMDAPAQSGIVSVSENGAIATTWPSNFSGFTNGSPSLTGGPWCVASDPAYTANIFVGGDFTDYVGATGGIYGIARLTSDGLYDTSWNASDKVFPPGDYDLVIGIIPDGGGGCFINMIGGGIIHRGSTGLASTYAAFNAAIGTAYNAIGLVSSGAQLICLSDAPTALGGSTMQYGICRISATTAAVDSTFNAASSGTHFGVVSSPGGDERLAAAIADATGRLYCAGLYHYTVGYTDGDGTGHSIGGSTVFRLLANGNFDATFTPLAINSGGQVNGFVIDASGDIIAFGKFTSIGGIARPNIARFTPAGAIV